MYTCSGYYLVFTWKLGSIRRENKLVTPGIPHKKLTMLSFDAVSFAALELGEEDEFCYHGNMYDIITRKTDARGNVVLYCFNDTHETNFLDWFRKHTEDNDDDATQHAFPRLFSVYLPPAAFLFAPVTKSNICYAPVPLAETLWLSEIPSPPPQFS